MTPLVSILIPVYNREHIISETINCAVNQTYKNIEIIICDNCSTDNTWEILKEWAEKDSRIKIFKNEKNLGPVLNWKECLDKAKGEYAKILWSDDLILETFIEHTLPLFDDETAFVMTGIKIFDSETNSIIFESKYQKKPQYQKKEYLYNCLIYKEKFPLSPGCALFRTTDLRQSLIIDIPNSDNLDFKKYGAGNDLLFFLITANKYEKIKCVNLIESFFRAHSDSLSISNKLNLYYEWVRRYFVKTYYESLSNKYKANLAIKRIIKKEYTSIYKSIPSPLNFFSLFSVIIESTPFLIQIICYNISLFYKNSRRKIS